MDSGSGKSDNDFTWEKPAGGEDDTRVLESTPSGSAPARPPVCRPARRAAAASGSRWAWPPCWWLGVSIGLLLREQDRIVVQPPSQTPPPATPALTPQASPASAAADPAMASDQDPGRRLLRPQAGERIAEMREMVGEQFDFEGARLRIEQTLANRNLPAARREQLERQRDMVTRFAQLRAEVTARAQKPGVQLTLVDPQHGRLTMTTADSTSFAFRDERGEIVRKEWSDLRPVDVVDMVRQLMGPGELTGTVDEFNQFFSIGGSGVAGQRRRPLSPEQRVAAPPPQTGDEQHAVGAPLPPGSRMAAPPRRTPPGAVPTATPAPR